MCFGGGDDGSSREMINMQKEEAKRAAASEANRQNRITQGLGYIKNMFEGAPEMRAVNRKFDWGAFNPEAKSGLPAGFSYVQIPGTAGTAGTMTATGAPATAPGAVTTNPAPGRYYMTPGGNAGNSGSDHGMGTRGGSYTTNPGGIPRFGGTSGSPKGGANTANSNPTVNNGGIMSGGTPGTAARWVVQGPDGRRYEVGSDLTYGDQEATGNKIGSWQDAFKNKFRQSMLDYYEPQVAEQFGEANNETIYRHARAGTLDSTSKIGNVADLVKQNDLNIGDVRAKADTAANDLGERIQRERAAAEAQLYSTENPEVAANAAQRAIQNITAETPSLTPLAEIFNIAAVGGANAYKGFTNAQRMNTGYGSGTSGRGQKLVG